MWSQARSSTKIDETGGIPPTSALVSIEVGGSGLIVTLFARYDTKAGLQRVAEKWHWFSARIPLYTLGLDSR
jgi:uncharacterized membrane protein YdcZ (DUF606 family)